MVEYRYFDTDLELFDVANLLDHAVVLLDPSMLVVQFLKIGLLKCELRASA